MYLELEWICSCFQYLRGNPLYVFHPLTFRGQNVLGIRVDWFMLPVFTGEPTAVPGSRQNPKMVCKLTRMPRF